MLSLRQYGQKFEIFLSIFWNIQCHSREQNIKISEKLDYRKSLANLFCTILIDKCLRMNCNQGLRFFKERNINFSEKLDNRKGLANLAVF